MRFCHALILAGLLLSQAVSVRPVFAADPPVAGTASSPNAAVVYWQAFAALPRLEDDQKAKYEAAIKSTTEPVSNDIQPIMARFDHALRELHRARGVRSCDWNLNYADGLELRMPHLQQARDLARAALLRARLRFAAKATDEAVADIAAVLKMAHDCGSSPLLISLLVDFAIEDMATEVLAANLATLSPPQLDSLAVALKTLPATPSVADCKRFEGRFHGESQLSESFLTSFAKAGFREEQGMMRKQLLLLAIHVQLNGPDAIKDATVPDHGPVEYRKTNSGFELRCRLKSADEPVVLSVATAR